MKPPREPGIFSGIFFFPHSCLPLSQWNPPIFNWRTLLRLGRISNLPTVWSNCLAGWWLGGGGNFWKPPFLLLGTSVLYTGGMFLSDAFDADFDRQRQPERPDSLGVKISVQPVWRLRLQPAWRGSFSALVCSQLAAGAAYTCWHCPSRPAIFRIRSLPPRPGLIGACRFWIYVIAGATGAAGGLNGWPIFCGMAAHLYVTGVSFISRRESFRTTLPRWPLFLSAAPIVLAFAMNLGRFPACAPYWIGVASRACDDLEHAKNYFRPRQQRHHRGKICSRASCWRTGWRAARVR
jgi:4-hydroxybenzoate polyprenyltransferase